MILLPKQAELIGGPELKGTTLGTVVLSGALISMLCAPLFGALSDRITTPWGRRRPWLVVGTLGNVAGLVALAYLPANASAVVPYVLVFVWISLVSNLATAPYSALIPDVVAPSQRGSASGWLGLMTMLGNFVGGAVGFVLGFVGGVSGAYVLLAVLLLLGMVGTVLSVREPPSLAPPPFAIREFLRSLVAPFRSRDFTWVFWTRFLVVMGTFTVQEFIQFYFKDVLGAPFRFFGVTLAQDEAAAASFFFLTLLIGAIASSLMAGSLSDRFGRKSMVYFAGGVQAVIIVVFILFHSYSLSLILGIAFGLGYGAYQSVDWALASDVLPSLDDYAKDMGVWHIALTLPQVIATPIAGVLLDTFQRVDKSAGNPHPVLGYTVIFSMAALFFILGTLLVRQVKGVR